MSTPESLLVEGRTCWRLAHCDRLAFIIDGAAFFDAVAASIERARESVLVLGWDFDSRVRLQRRGPGDGDRLGDLLRRTVARRRELHVHVLEWDFAMMFAFERGLLPLFSHRWPEHRRIHFRYDGQHPPGASHHQKVVVIDDRIAYAGGLDLTGHRWDTPKHAVDDPRRVDPRGSHYGPFHDLAVALDGDAAMALGDLVRGRWRRLTGDDLPRPARGDDAWPATLPSDLEDVEVGIARTSPKHGDQQEVREVERLFLDSIAVAERCIYIENQYLTSAAIADALAARLRAEQGPEVVVVLPRDSSGWLEQSTMDVLRTRIVRELRAADRHDRLRIYFPVVPDGDDGTPVYMHGKLMIVDDRLARVGSANLSNRSMGLDTECDIAVEAGGREDVAAAIAGLRDRLLGEHLGAEAGRVGRALAASDSLVGAVESLRGGERTLRPLDREAPPWLLETLPDREVVDPERPIDLEDWIERYVPSDVRQRAGTNYIRIAGLAAVSALLVTVLSLTPLGTWLDPSAVAAAVPLKESLASPLIVASVFVAGGLLLVPVTLLTVATVVIYGTVTGFVYAVLAAGASALTGYWVGRRLSRNTVRSLVGRRTNRISRRLALRGLFSVVAVRLLPVIPFSAVNLVAGAGRVRVGDFALGSLIGTVPSLVAATLFANRMQAALEMPGPLNLLLLGVAVLVIAGGAVTFARWLGRDRQSARR